MIKVIIRTSGERSYPLCYAACAVQTDDIQIVKASPFIRAVEKTFEYGSKSDKKWLLAVDADVVLDKDALSRVVAEAEAKLSEVPLLFKMDFGLRDKFRGSIYGCHLYKNEYSGVFYEQFSKVAHDPLVKRPESTNIRIICDKLGLSKINAKSPPIGTHDFEQFFSHLYVKYYNRAVRDAKSYEKILRNLNQKALDFPNDPDFRVVLAGLLEGNGKAEMQTDSSRYPDTSDVLLRLGLAEKTSI